MEKQDEWAAAISSSGLVCPSGRPIRVLKVTASSCSASLVLLTVRCRERGRHPRLSRPFVMRLSCFAPGVEVQAVMGYRVGRRKFTATRCWAVTPNMACAQLAVTHLIG
jgi:hypothetical protein